MLNCKQLNEGATRFLENEYGFFEKVSFWMHLVICVHCRRYIKQLKLAVETVRLMSRFSEPSAEEIDTLVSRLKPS